MTNTIAPLTSAELAGLKAAASEGTLVLDHSGSALIVDCMKKRGIDSETDGWPNERAYEDANVKGFIVSVIESRGP